MELLFVFVYVGVCVCVRLDEGSSFIFFCVVLFKVRLFVILRVCCSLEDPTNFSNGVLS